MFFSTSKSLLYRSGSFDRCSIAPLTFSNVRELLLFSPLLEFEFHNINPSCYFDITKITYKLISSKYFP